jgi:pyruvate formate lyase activating enzyme
MPHILKIHADARRRYGLPERIPADRVGIACGVCVNQCRIGEGNAGYCGVRYNQGGKIIGPNRAWAYCDWYHDPLPTNCVADFVCAGHNECGFKNLAAFYEGCTFNCLFCQNWHYRERKTKTTAEDLARAADPATACTCFFGGDPTPFAEHSCEVAKCMSEKTRLVRMCWETNGSVAPRYMTRWVEYALQSNGCIKIDFKAFSYEMSMALCGSSNRFTKENIKLVARYMARRRKPPMLILSTLLIPGYVDEYELEGMARFISSIDQDIPWSFLGFAPHFYFGDVPPTSQKQVEQALEIAEAYGIERTHVGNVHLLT